MAGRCTRGAALSSPSAFLAPIHQSRPSSAGASSVSRRPAVAPDGRHPRALRTLSFSRTEVSSVHLLSSSTMATTSSSSELMARLLPSVPFPFSSSSSTSVRSKQLFGERQALAEIKQETSYTFATPDRKPGFRFESLATEFETAEENDSGIG